MTGFLGCCFGFGYIAAKVVHYPPALFVHAPLPKARLPSVINLLLLN